MILLSWLFISYSVSAAESDLSHVYLSVTGDSHRTSDIQLGADVFLPGGSHVFGHVGRTRVPSVEGEPSLDSRDFRIGYGTDPRAKQSLSGSFGAWTHEKLQTITLEAEGVLHTLDWDFALRPGYRNINVSVGNTAPAELRSRGDRFVVQNPYLAGDLGFVGWSPWVLNGGIALYRYSENMNLLKNADYGPYFGQSVILLSTGFAKVRSFLNVEYHLEMASFALEYQRQVSAIDDNPSNTGLLRVGLMRFHPVEFEMEVGHTKFESGSNDFAGVTVLYFWK